MPFAQNPQNVPIHPTIKSRSTRMSTAKLPPTPPSSDRERPPQSERAEAPSRLTRQFREIDMVNETLDAEPGRPSLAAKTAIIV